MLTRLTTPKDPDSADLIPFGDCSAACTFVNLQSDPVLPVAMAVLAGYHGQSEPPAWESLPAWKRHANISPAMHLNAKLRVLGLRLMPSGSAGGLSVSALPQHEDIDEGTATILARMEHNRWMAERLLLGWSLGVQGKPENKRRHQFVPWEMLKDPVEREKDYSQLVAVLRVCRVLVDGREAGFVVVRV